jgi:hypothetical protein
MTMTTTTGDPTTDNPAAGQPAGKAVFVGGRRSRARNLGENGRLPGRLPRAKNKNKTIFWKD